MGASSIATEEDDDPLLSSNSEDEAKCKAIRAATLSDWFKILVAYAIVLNTLVMAFQADYPKWTYPSGCTDQCTNVWDLINNGFLLFFTVELTMRFITFGCRNFFCDKDWAWGWFDFAVVLMGWLDLLSRLLMSGGGSKLVTIIRAVRILRILRVLRIFKQLRGLQVLVSGLASSMSLVFWIFLLIMMLIFISSIFCTNVIGHASESFGDEMDHIEEYWGKVERSMLTLFQILTLDDWNLITRTVMVQMPLMQIFFIAYVIFAAFVILSLLTGVMAEHMQKVSEDEAEKDAMEKMDSEETLPAMHRAFLIADADKNGELDRGEFNAILSNPEAIDELEGLGLNLGNREAVKLFDIFDTDRSGSLTWDQFRECLMSLRKEQVTPKDVLKVHTATSKVLKRMKEGERPPDIMHDPASPSLICEQLLGEIDQKVTNLEMRLQTFEASVREAIRVGTGRVS